MSIPVRIQIGDNTPPIVVGRILAATAEELHVQVPDLLRDAAAAYEAASNG